MKIAIHDTRHSFGKRWSEFCRANNIPFRAVDCYESDIVQDLADCGALMWQINQGRAEDMLFSKQLLYALQCAGKQVFPDYRTMWHFEDKVGQKYLLEAINAPLVKSWVFYDKRKALDWAKRAEYPIVFKLRTGAGSENVYRIDSERKAKRVIRRAFGRGFCQYAAWSNLKERCRLYRLGKKSLFDVLKGFVRLVWYPRYSRVAGREKGYVYFQEFIAGNDHDIRVVVIDGRAFALKRMVRAGDFRASGSGHILYDRELFDEDTIALSFDLAERLGTQCVAFDYAHKNGQPLVIEISYGFNPEAYDSCPGYWDRKLKWHEGSFNPYGWMVNLVLERANEAP